MSLVLFFPGLTPTTYDAISEFATTHAYAKQRFAEADEVLGYSLIEAYKKASIYDWEVYQSGVMALALALADWAEEHYAEQPGLCGGQSYGAVMAAVRAGTLSYADALRLMSRSVRVEQDYFASQPEPIGCHFFYKLSYDTVMRLIEEFRAQGEWMELSIAFDASVHAVSASLGAIARFEERVRQEGGIPFYTVDRAEHCSANAGLRDRLAKEVYGSVTWNDPVIPIISDVDGRLLTEGAAVREDLLDGWTTPIHWQTIVQGISRGGGDRVWIPGPRNMFARISNRVFPTRVISPRTALAA
ncbi:malonyl CoA-acyl carrier protein transacylase [Streptomyces spiroverticillatus]|uniref:[acyl-carrier-protein] S-malonyltransferase n=1 Tax=Streptomyces finlayi TaxID=67296 RepID=A0A919CDX4_9ACTN|nr:ACP S-malonyltransferase [Streptomyces finlayi]GHA36138.1 malonyl CoA-acyl carrier protein transacylase [Streptomyces spiroverticillatus]GHD12418.1 malonyl CoA-acyl carrier protein transacylase [Streptomyces finlayi]